MRQADKGGSQIESIKLESKRERGKESLNKYGSGSQIGSSLIICK